MLIIHNPTAGRRHTAYLNCVVDLLHSRGATARVVATTGPGHATTLAAEACARGEARIVAAGGDGTIAETAMGLAGGGAALGVIPLGTANVLAHERGLGFAPAAVAETLAGAGRAPLWPAYARTAAGTRLFVQMCGIGFDAHVVRTLNPALKRRLGRGAYVVQTVLALRGYDFPRLRLELDGVVHEAASAVISKGRLYAGPYRLLPAAPPGASGFQVALFRHGHAAAVLLYGALLPLQLLPHGPGVTLLPARRVRLLEGIAPVQTDGDAWGMAPLHLEDAAVPIALMVPEVAEPGYGTGVAR